MAQRELKVRVTGEIDKSLEKLIRTLDSKSNYKLNVRLNIEEGGLRKLLNSLDSVSNKKASVQVDADTSGLAKAENQLNNLTSSISKASNQEVSVKGNASGLDVITDTLGEVEASVNDVTNSTAQPKGDDSLLQPLIATLDEISSKILDVSRNIADAIGLGDQLKSATDLYDSQKSFENQMASVGKSRNWINQNLAALNEYGAKSKYSIAEMVDAMAQFEGMGVKGSKALVTGVAGISSYAKNASKAMKGVNYQLLQMDKNSKVYTGDWRAIQNNIGGAAAKAIKDWFKVNKGIELTKDSMRDGKIEAKDLFQAITEVGNSDRFQSMAKQVNTVNSAMENLQETITAQLVGDGSKKGGLSKFYDGYIGFLNDLTDQIPRIAGKLSDGMDALSEILERDFGKFSAKGLVDGISNTVGQLGKFVSPFSRFVSIITNRGKNVGTIMGSMLTAALAWKGVSSVIGPIGQLAGVFNQLNMAFGKSSKAPKASPIPTGGMLDPKAGLMNSISGFVKGVGSILAVAASIKLITSALKDLDSLDMNFSELGQKMAIMATTVGVFGTAAAAIGYALAKFPAIAKYLLAGSAAITIINGALMVNTLIMEQTMKSINRIGKALNNMPEVNNLTTKVLNLGKIMTAMAALGTMQIATAPITLIGSTLQMFANLTFSGSLAGLKNILNQINSFPDVNPSSISKKLLAIVKLQTVLSMAGGTSIASAGLNVVSGFANMLQAFANITFAGNLSSLRNLLNQLNSIELPNADAVVTKIKSLKKVMNAISGQGMGNPWSTIGAGFKAMGSAFEAASTNLKIGQFKNVVSFVKQLSQIEPIDDAGIKTKLNSIKKVMNYLAGEGGSGGILKQIATTYNSAFKAIGSAFKGADVNNKAKVFKNLVKLVKDLQSMPTVTDGGIKAKLDGIKKVLEQLSSFKVPNVQAVNKDQKGDIDKLVSIVKKISGAIKTLSSVDTGVDLTAKVDQIKKAAQQLASIQIPTIDKGQTENVSKLSSIVKSMTSIAKKIGEIAAIGDLSQVGSKIDQVKNAVKKVAESAKGITDAKLPEDASSKVATMQKIVSSLTKIATSLSTIPTIPEDITSRVQKISNVIKSEAFKSFSGQLAGFKKDDGGIQTAVAAVKAMSQIGNAMNAIPVVADDIQERVSKILKPMALIKYSFQGVAGGKGSTIAPESVTAIVTAVQSMVTIGNSLNSLPTIADDVTQRISKIKSAINQISGLFAGSAAVGFLSGGLGSLGGGVEGIVSKVDAIVQVANKLNSMPAIGESVSANISALKNALNQLATVTFPTSFGQGIQAAMAQLNAFLSSLSGMAGRAQAGGQAIGNGIVNGFRSVPIEGMMASKLNQAVNTAGNQAASAARSAGQRIGQAIADGINVGSIISKINSIQGAINALRGKTIEITTVERKVKKANGGLINPEYHSSGGFAGRGSNGLYQTGTDTVAAMLTPGEFVMKRSASNALGERILTALNNMNIKTAMMELGNKFGFVGNQNSTNITNNITQNVDNKSGYYNGLDRLGRVMRP